MVSCAAPADDNDYANLDWLDVQVIYLEGCRRGIKGNSRITLYRESNFLSLRPQKNVFEISTPDVTYC